MSKNTLVTGIFDNADSASAAISALLRGGIASHDVNVVASDTTNFEAFGIQKHSKAGQGAAIGGGLGGAAGAILAGLTAVGTIATGGAGLIAAGPIVAALAGAGAGAATGGIIGGLIGFGVPEHQVKFFKDAVARGCVLVGATVPAERVTWVKETLDAHGSTQTSTEGAPTEAATSVSSSSSRTFATQNENHLYKLFIEQLKDIYYAESQLVDAIPKMRDAATNLDLSRAFATHLEETRGHVTRLERVFASIGEEAKEQKCPAIHGIISEAKELMKLDDSPAQRDAAIICAAQKVEHYEMATYGCLKAYARTLGLSEALSLLSETYQEEMNADKLLTNISFNANEVAACNGVQSSTEIGKH